MTEVTIVEKCGMCGADIVCEDTGDGYFYGKCPNRCPFEVRAMLE